MINLVNVRKSFGELEVLKDINLQIHEKEIYGIIGQSGACKSTLLRCINGLETYDSGTITVDGTVVDENDKKQLRQLRKDMGMIFQNFNLLSRLDVYDNVALPLRFWNENPNTEENKKKIEHLIELVGLKDKMHERPENLSGGQKQRVAIARALVNDPKILLCDEATSALDPRITHGILELLKQINEELGITIVVVTHQMEVVKQICQRVAFLKHGVVLAEGKPEELFVKPTEDVKKFLGEEGQVLQKAGVNVQLFFTDDSSDEPVITEMARELGIDFSICWAKLGELRESVFGSLILNIQEKDKERVFQVGTSMEYEQIFKRIIIELQRCQDNYEEMLVLLLRHLLIIFHRELTREHISKNEYLDHEMDNAVTFFSENYNQNISIDDYAASRGMSVSWFIRNFKKYTGSTPDRKSTRLNSSHSQQSRMPSSA